MSWLPYKSENKKIAGAELIVTGGVLLASKFVLGLMAPAALCVYGVYRWLVKKSYPDGIISIALGILLYVAINTFGFLLWIPTILGLVAILWGATLLFMPQSKNGAPPDDRQF